MAVTPEEAAAGLLLEQRLRGLRVNVLELRYPKKIVFDSMQHYCATTRTTMAELRSVGDTRDGFTIVRELSGGRRFYLVLYNLESENPRRRSFTLAHEMGHIHLDHRDDGPRQEEEANRFAAGLLLPEILVWEMARRREGHLGARELSEAFGVSLAAAQFRLRAMGREEDEFSSTEWALLQKLGGFLPDPRGPVVSI